MIQLLRVLKPYRLVLLLVLFFAFGQALSNLYLPNLMADIVNNGIVKDRIDYIWQVGGQMVLVAVGGTICALIGIFLSVRVAAGFGKIIRARLFQHVSHFSLQEFDSISTASLITRTTNDTTQVQQMLVMVLTLMITAPITLVGGIILALSQDVELSWILVATIPVLVLTVVILMRQAIPMFISMQQKLDGLNLLLGESLAGVRVVRAFDRISDEELRFTRANRDLTDLTVRVNRVISFMMPIMTLVLNVSSVAILWFGALRIDNGAMQIGSLLAFLQYATQILFALMMLSIMIIMLPRAAASATRINEVLAIRPEIKDAPQVRDAGDLTGYVEFQNVTFSYPGSSEPALSQISFSAYPGQVTAIIGGTGSGKTTLMNLIPRFYDVDDGCVLVDGVDVRDLAQQALRQKIGFVPQQSILFSGSIAENIRYGKAAASLEEVQHAAEVAQASDFIQEIPEGFAGLVAQGGLNLSGGQKQRLAIARALVRQPEIYLFDDSFSALDVKTDAQLRAALKQETQQATVLLVAQRVSTVMDADRILVLDDGHIVGSGTHQALMYTCDVYREIVASQLSAAEMLEEII